MKTEARIELYSPGIVVFDPEVLKSFLNGRGIRCSNIFEEFLEKEELGRAAIEQGVVYPIYQIPEDEYSVFVSDQSFETRNLVSRKFSYSGFPLCVTSEILIVSDLYALLDWDPGFFCDYKKNYKNKLLNNDYIEVPKGRYSLTISGYVGLDFPFRSLGYGINFRLVDMLPKVSETASVDEKNFVLENDI
ncbi:hypothetical protein V2K77_07870 [Pseudomonas alliivorans]|nr:hypothetical protein [Pseudomonas alliivorans]MEE4712998.1 hypothetical protein [Pseudomonas alliivorans]MEE4729151.1 hypothetical protein [Pseudomonas alliivorans]MEE4768109.1 hypothetical protein [Pseudomonas alliivorans]